MRHLLYFLTLKILLILPSFGTSYATPNLGFPLVYKDQILISDSNWGSKQLICLDINTGNKLWSITAVEEGWQSAWSVPGEALPHDYLVQRNGQLYSCSPKDGKLTDIYDTKLDQPYLRQISGSKLLVAGSFSKNFTLKYIDIQSRKELWSMNQVHGVMAVCDEILLVKRETMYNRDKKKNSYQLKDPRLAAISLISGEILWEIKFGDMSFNPKAIAAENAFIVTSEDRVKVFASKDGKVLETIKNEGMGGRWKHVHLLKSSEGVFVYDSVFVEKEREHHIDKVKKISTTNYTLSEVDRRYVVGSDETRFVVRPSGLHSELVIDTDSAYRIFSGSSWRWRGVHDGKIYYSGVNSKKTRVVLVELDLKSGDERQIYSTDMP